jgi:hypothetical protein
VFLVANLIQSVLSLLELKLRRDWLLDYLPRLPTSESAALLDALCKSSERGEPTAHEALSAWVAGLVTLGDSPWVQALRQESISNKLLSLNRILQTYASVSTAPETAIKVPDYGAGRELTVGERRSLARQPNRRTFEKLLRDPHPLVLRNLLGNPRLTEDDILRLAAKRPLRESLTHELVQRPEWLLRPRIRLTLLHNPYTRSHLALPLLVLCKRDELAEVLENTSLHPVLRTSARELLDRRPPLSAVPTSTVH